MYKVRQAVRKHRKLLSVCAMVLAIALMFWAVNSPAIVGVSAAKRVLPIYSVQRDDRVVSLSFDAAWGNEDTQMLIDILNKYNVHATFFVVGEWVDKYPESVKALADAGVTKGDIDAVAVTYAPGLIGAVLVGLSFAKSVAYALGVPLIPVHHIRGHIAANYLAFPELEPPFVCLVVSGGHSLIVDVQDYTKMRILGTTRDDAAGECFDKVARVLGMPYPGGAALDRQAKLGDDEKYPMPHSHVAGCELDMSFSGLKTAALNLIHNAEQKGETLDIPSLCASFSKAVSDTLVPRTMQALRMTGYRKLAIAGGVAANSRIRQDFENACRKERIALYRPPLSLCGDNGAMIGSQGYYEYLAGTRGDQALNAYATRSIELG